MAVTEAFVISNLDESKIGYVDIDRTYKYGGLMILDDDAFPDSAGVKGCTYFEEFDEIICKWCENLGINNQTIKLKVNWDVDNDININVIKDKKDIIFNIDIKNGEISKAYCNDLIINNDSWEDTTINNEYVVGVFGLIFNYYTKLITNEIKEYENNEIYEIWGYTYE